MVIVQAALTTPTFVFHGAGGELFLWCESLFLVFPPDPQEGREGRRKGVEGGDQGSECSLDGAHDRPSWQPEYIISESLPSHGKKKIKTKMESEEQHQAWQYWRESAEGVTAGSLTALPGNITGGFVKYCPKRGYPFNSKPSKPTFNSNI